MAIQAGAFIFADDHNIPVLSYTPQLLASISNPALGSDSIALGRYWRDPITGRCWGQIVIKFGSSGVSAGSGDYRVVLPRPADPFFSDAIGQADIWGSFSIRDDSATNASRHGLLTRFNDWDVSIGGAVANLSLLDGSNALVTHSVPWPWGAWDAIAAWFDYPSLTD